MRGNKLDAAYYQALHDTHQAFQNNNWLLQDIDRLIEFGGKSLLELGCGNGRFLALAADHWDRVVGLDWARSPMVDDVIARHANVEFIQADVLAWRPDDRFDLVVSADFLEHLPPESLVPVLQRFDGLGAGHYHRIACYDDGHSHLSIFPPERWMEVFERACPNRFELLSSEPRKGNREKLVITVGARPSLDAN